MSSPLNQPSVRAKVVNLNTGAVSIEYIPISQIVIPSKPVSELSELQVNRVTLLYQKVGYVMDATLEKWIHGFTYDLHPERGIRVWEEIAAVFGKYNKTYNLTLNQKREVVRRLIRLVGGEQLSDSVSLELIELLQEKRASMRFLRPSKSQQLWEKIDYRMFAQIYTEYVERHQIGIQDNKHELFVTLTRLMEGNEPSSDLGIELLGIWKELVEFESDNQPDFDPDNISDERQKKSREVVTRPGQRKFKLDLMKAYGGRCSITDNSVDVVLEAAHIIPYSGAKTDHPSNGLLLRGDIHKLFDSHYLSINPETYQVEIAPILRTTHYEKLAGKSLRMPKSKTERPNPKALSKHYEIFSSRWPLNGF